MSEYVPTIGLEIHAELQTRTKMFCDSRNDPNEARPNVNICPVCLAHPGTLPVINREAVQHTLRIGVALKGRLADYTEFDRKNYFYPDLPKGYQISQYEHPLVSGGSLNNVRITRVHLEEDTASSIHDDANNSTLIDYNRAGVPLMELVTEPAIHSAKEASDFARALQLLLQYLGASGANMEKGEMRVEANVSIGQKAKGKKQTLGTKVEIKNLNSFRAVERAIESEIERQIGVLESGKLVVRETRGWDEGKQETFSQRLKEISADYRYFPDPDLPSLRVSEIDGFSFEALNRALPELPEARYRRYIALGLKSEDATQFVKNTILGDFFDQVFGELPDNTLVPLAANYISNDLANCIRDTEDRYTQLQAEIPIRASYFTKLLRMINQRAISSRGAKDILAEMLSTGDDAETIADRKGLNQMSSEDALLPTVRKVLNDHESAVRDYKGGKESALKYLIGQAMRELRGAGNPEVIATLLLSEIDKS